MPIVGYTDRLTVEPGQTVDFKISCTETDFSASLVRPIHGDANPAVPGFRSHVRIPHRVGPPYLGAPPRQVRGDD